MTAPGAGPWATIPKWDAHCHLFENGFAGRYSMLTDTGAELRVYEAFRREHSIGRALVVGYEGEPRYAGNNAYIAGLAERRPWLVPLAFVAPQRPPSAAKLEELFERGYAGLSIYAVTEIDGAALAAWPRPVLDVLSRRRAVVSLNATTASTPLLTGWVSAVAPGPVLFSHLGLPGPPGPPGDRSPAERLAPLLRLARSTHVVVKLSGQYAASASAFGYPHTDVRPLVDLVFESFGAERLCWASDFPACLDSISLDQSVHVVAPAGLSEGERRMIFGENLERVLGPVNRDRGASSTQ